MMSNQANRIKRAAALVLRRAWPIEPPRILIDASPETIAEAERWRAERPGRLVVEIQYV